MRLNHAAVVDHRIRQRISGLRGHHDHAAIGFDQTSVLCQSINRTLVDGVIDQSITGKIEQDILTGDQGAAAAGGLDCALIDNLRGDQRNHSTIQGIDLPLIEDISGVAAGEMIGARQEIRVVHIEG